MNKEDLSINEARERMVERGILERPVGDETMYRWARAGYFVGAHKAIGLPGSPWRIPEEAIEKFTEHYGGGDEN